MLHAEALLFIHQNQAEIAELHVLRQQPVRADGDIDLAFGEIRQGRLDFLGRAEAAEHLHAHRKRLKAPLKCLKMLECQDRGGRQKSHLLAIAQRLESGAHRHFGFAVTHVAAEQAVHGLLAFHVALDVGDGGDLVLGGSELESILKLALPIAVPGELKALGHFALGVELEQLVRHVAHLGLDAGLGAGPGGAAHAVQCGLALARSAEALHQVHARQRYVELGVGGIFQKHVVALGFALSDLP